ncbi:MAG: T9SS type A sorting domain-containing protein, partial [Ignavibacteriae bacterium]|nr:T9SS type A sorting domain-containing protein [Ignavibacteriota bacterium]
MKILLLIFSIVIFMYSPLSAQPGWFQLNSGTTESLQSVYFTDANTGYAVGNPGTVLKTTDAGATWFSQSIPTTDILHYVLFTDVNTGYIASGVYASNGGNLFKTTNGGNSWNAQILPNYAHFYSIYFNNSNTGYVSGSRTILKTTNAGITWQYYEFPNYHTFTSIYFVDINTGFATGSKAYYDLVIIKTTDGGTSWFDTFANSAYGYFFYGINFIDANTGVAVGGYTGPGNAFILRTTNGGVNWDWIDYIFNLNDIYWSVKFVSPAVGYIAGGGTGFSTILKTTNSGQDWYYQTTNANNFLRGSYFTSLNTGYVAGNGGTILKTTDGGGTLPGINPFGNQIPAQFALSQNYPNPFNPVTKIIFDVPVCHSGEGQNQVVSLIVYDMLGREIETLVSQKLNAGTYSVDFNGSKLTSGVYFCRMQSGEF